MKYNWISLSHFKTKLRILLEKLSAKKNDHFMVIWRLYKNVRVNNEILSTWNNGIFQ